MQVLSPYLKQKSFSLLILVFSFATAAKAQLKVGDNPTTIQKSSILELESTRQGLLLPRLSDTTGIDALTPPNGMIIYLSADNSLRIRSEGYWKKLASMGDAMANWSTNGNTGTNPATSFIGTLDSQPLNFRTANNQRMTISSTGQVGIGTASPSATLNVDGTVKLENLAAGSTAELEVLVIANDGSVYKRSVSETVFTNAIKAINGIQSHELSITAGANTSKDTVEVENITADSTIAIHLPVQDGASGSSKPYGFLQFSDWQKIESAIQTITIGTVASSGDVKGASIVTNGTGREIVLHPATATTAGIVTTGAQTFGGNKTFQDNVSITGNATVTGNTTLSGTATVDGNLTLNALANNTSSDSVLVVNNGVIEKRQVSPAAFEDAVQSINGNRDTAQAIAFTSTGTDLSVTTNGTDSIFLNVPSAGASARGVVTTAAQTFGGIKTFQDSVAAASALKVGATGNANSTVQISGSVSMAIRTITADATLDGTDNTVLVNTTSTAITVTLPSPTGKAGRIYTIKKIGTGGIDNDLTIAPGSGITIDGGADYKIYNDYTFVTLQTDGSQWYIIKK